MIFPVFKINKNYAVRVDALTAVTYRTARQIIYLLKKKILPGFKYAHRWYAFLPINRVAQKSIAKVRKINPVSVPYGGTVYLDWEAIVQQDDFPEDIREILIEGRLIFILRKETSFLVAEKSSTLNPNRQTSPELLRSLVSRVTFVSLNEGNFVSEFLPGDGGTLKSVTTPAAFFEIARLLDESERTRNGANPGLVPKRNITVNVSFDTGLINVAATMPYTTELVQGVPSKVVTNYLGTTYSAFTPGTGGTLKSTNSVAAFIETATVLSATEKAVTPIDDQPNNIQINFDDETQLVTVSATLPFTTSATATGDVITKATDYL